MKRIFLISGLFLLCVAGIVLAVKGRPLPQANFVPGEALVQFKPTVSESAVQRLISQAGVTLKERIDPQRIYVVRFPERTSPAEIVSRFQKMPEVAHAEANGVYEPFLWDLWFSGQVWAEETSGSLGAGAKVRVAVIDTAIDANHPVLSGKVTSGYNFVSDTTSTQSSGVGQDWHGTASAGRVLDGAGGSNIEIMPVQVFGSSGGASWSTILKAINYAVDNGAQVINMSLGGTSYSPFVQQAIDRATEKGIVVVASAGNWNTSAPAYPAAMSGVISVAATNEQGKKAGFSNYGSTVDISAPGDTMKLLSHGGYRMAAGTSFSAPFITGMVALLKSAFPFLTAKQCEDVLKAKANDVDEKNPKHKGELGAGFLSMLDVKKWVSEIRAGTFQFPWGQRAPAPPGGQPGVAPVPQPWLVRGRGHSGDYLLTPAGDVVSQDKKQ